MHDFNTVPVVRKHRSQARSIILIPTLRGIPGEPNSARVPPYHRLDLQVDRNWIFDTWILSAYFEIQNVYNRANQSDSIQYDFTNALIQVGYLSFHRSVSGGSFEGKLCTCHVKPHPVVSLWGVAVVRGWAGQVRSPQILGILSDRNEIPIEDLVLGSAGVLTVGVVDFHPSDLTDAPIERRYEWQLCFSLGSIAKFECVSPDNILEPVGMEATTEFNLDSSAISRLIPPEFLALVGDPVGVAPPNDDGTTATCPERLGYLRATSIVQLAQPADGICVGLPAISPVPLVAAIRMEGEAVTAARSVNIRFSGAANQNPRLGGMSIGKGQFQPKALTASVRLVLR